MSNKIRNAMRLALDAELMEYQNIDRKIAVRQMELSIKNIFDLDSYMIEKIGSDKESDLVLYNLGIRKQTIARLFMTFDKEEREIADHRWNKGRQWAEIEEIMHMSEPTLRRRKNKMLDRYAKLKGLI
ncbi:hypothetical protein H702_07120 [Streptococcus equinus JB1]|uniref:Uncharacterized protein n=1 Tax=Streptococcus equinus JB1 TaxID=1294274 RepID=A0A091BP41_STREI|nr:hypothetical protein [Streptococcus equinus]KFN87426.1 hypothetical protein H702_07120 [Streptococcus equinus JB1]QBX15718.1 transcriptional regulator [Streptococcus phage Javan207]SFL16123.1 hypothetical protein SAMN02910290_00703 [Streptococcus equinus JB1]